MPEQPSDERFPRSARIRSPKTFERIFKQRIRSENRWIVLYAGTNEENLARLGLAVGRRFGNAVQRNRIKRLIREAFRRVRSELPGGSDWIVVPKPGAEPTVTELLQCFRELAASLSTRLPAPPPTALRREGGPGC